MLSIRRCSHDEPAFRALIVELDQDLLKRYGAKQGQYDLHNQGLEEAYVAVGFKGEEPVGCACFKVFEPGKVVEIKRMYVQPASRQLGIAQQLLTALEEWARETGHSTAILQTASKQPEAIGLYRKCGYQVTACYGVYTGDTDSVCMKKKL